MMRKRAWLQWATALGWGGHFGLGRAEQRPVASTHAAPPWPSLTIFIPASPGGGWDQTGRVLGGVLQSAGLVGQVRYENLGGKAGLTGLATFAERYKGRPDALMVTGMVMLGGIALHRSALDLSRLNPLAQLTSDYLVIAVPAASPLRTAQDWADRLRDPTYKATVVGGSAGGVDHILLGMMLRSLHANPANYTYLSTSGGGQASKALQNRQADWGISGYSELADAIHAGQVRPLAISSQHTEMGLPSLRDVGIYTTLVNWRGLCAPSGLTPPQLEALQALIDRAVTTPAWREELRTHRWLATYRNATAFRRFIETEQSTARVVVSLLKLNGS